MTVRLFAALEIPEENLKRLIAIRKSIYDDANLRWETKEKLHLTVKFFGNVDSNNVEQIDFVLNDISKKYTVFESSFTKFGLFYRDNKPAVLWAGIKPIEKLKSFVSEINKRMAELGFAEDKRIFKPHLTLLRIKGNNIKINSFKNNKIKIDNFVLSKLKLIKSELTPKGSIYKTVKGIELRNDKYK